MNGRFQLFEEVKMTISIEHANRLREEWAAKGSPLCDHPKLLKEKEPLGRDTGDYTCNICGETRWGRDWNKSEKTDNPE